MLDANFPNIVSRLQFLEQFSGYNVNIFNQIENKEHFFNLLVGKRSKVIFYGAVTILKMIENYFTHGVKLALLRTHGKVKK